METERTNTSSKSDETYGVRETIVRLTSIALKLEGALMQLQLIGDKGQCNAEALNSLGSISQMAREISEAVSAVRSSLEPQERHSASPSSS